MCFGSDAEHWTNLGSNVKNVYIYSHQSQSVSISENWFATHITTLSLANLHIAYRLSKKRKEKIK